MLRWMAALACAALLAAACGGGTDKTKAQLRLVNASSGYTTLQLNVDGSLLQGGVTYGGNAGYSGADPGKPSTITQPASAAALLSFTPSTNKGSYYTVLAYGAQGALAQVVLDDNQGQPATDKSLLRIVNTAADAGSLDIYLTGSSDSLASSVALQSGASAGAVGPWLTVNTGTWRLRITAAGSKTDLRLDLPALVLSSKQIVTLVLSTGRGGALVNALLLNQQGDISRQDSTQARVRVAAGVAQSGAVSAALGGSALLGSTNSPVVGIYAVVSAGSQAVSVSVNGTALAPSTTTLAAGADYTLLVHGTPAAPLASWIEDDNRQPSDSSQAKLRLVNGVSGLAVPLALTSDLVPVASNVAAGAGSAYAMVAPSTTAALTVTAAGQSAPVFSATTQILVAGANYSLFVLGDAANLVGTLRRDR